MKKHFLLIFAAVLCLMAPTAFAQSRIKLDKEHLNVSAGGRYNHILNGQDIYGRLVKTYGSGQGGFEVGLDTHPSDSSWWAQAFNFPHLGLGFSYDHTGGLASYEGSKLGDFYNLYGSLQFDFFRVETFSLGMNIDVGVAYTPERYHYFTNPGNVYIGSRIEAIIGAGLEAKWRFLPQWEIALGGYLTHHSNGMTRVPNSGINQAGGGARLRYYLSAPEKYRKLDLAAPDFPRGWHWTVFAAAGVHSCDVERMAMEKQMTEGERPYDDNSTAPARFRGILGTEAEWRYHRLLSTSIGLEGNYAVNDYRMMDRVLKGQEDPRGYSPFYVSVGITQHLHFENFSLHVGWGAYVFRKTGLSEDMDWHFQRIGVRYLLPSFKTGRMYLGFDMRAHFLDRSYCLETTVGFKL
ncbi:MAG: acyloxyacyl hydrolase [Bacteroidales bacterium]|nr:acyloxyacyl hydrolase [Bacteroidales bacterium]